QQQSSEQVKQQQQSDKPSQVKKRKRSATLADLSAEGTHDNRETAPQSRPLKRSATVHSTTIKGSFDHSRSSPSDLRPFSIPQQHGGYTSLSFSVDPFMRRSLVSLTAQKVPCSTHRI